VWNNYYNLVLHILYVYDLLYILSLWWSVGSMECMMCMCTYLFTCYAHVLVDLCNTTVSVCWIFAVTLLVYLQIKEINFTVQTLAEFHANGNYFILPGPNMLLGVWIKIVCRLCIIVLLWVLRITRRHRLDCGELYTVLVWPEQNTKWFCSGVIVVDLS
jgi:hypothetical protein